ncbi:MAG TPA: hypothetical protein PKD26_05645 [Pyrinomonadaceae bacterium]|nr:hypothetical protein [Pyrinomonadaceae bacterium]
MKFIPFALFIVAVFSITSTGQRPEVTITLNEAFFDSLLDSVFQNTPPIEFSIAANIHPITDDSLVAFSERGPRAFDPASGSSCKEVVQILRENSGVRSAVRFREGKILAPLAFTGNYSPPLIGCVPFSGYAETSIELEYDQQNQRLVARAKVLNVRLNGTGGVGGSVIARLIQGSIDRKINPIPVFSLDKVSFLIPIHQDSSLRMNAVGFRYQVVEKAMNIHIAYEIVKG